MIRTMTAVFSAIVAVFAMASSALAADLIAPGPYSVAAPNSLCAHKGNLRAIEKRFGIQARRVHHQPGLKISGIVNIHEHRYHAKTEECLVERHYCHATAHMSDGQTRKLWYLIEVDEGFAGFGLAFGDNVEFCLSGLDRWNVYNGACRVLR